jgi:hypothetical protein
MRRFVILVSDFIWLVSKINIPLLSPLTTFSKQYKDLN